MASSLSVFARKKREKSPLVLVALYDAVAAHIAAEAGVDAILVGDSLGNTVLGFDSTLAVTVDDIARHLGAVVRGVRASARPDVPVLADLPLEAMTSDERAVEVSVRFLQLGASAVKFEGVHPELAARLRSIGVPFVGHVGYVPQSALGFESVVQGRTARDAARLQSEVGLLQEQGAFAVVLEAVAAPVARHITTESQLATIGIGAGAGCDGQILVWNDLVGLTPKVLKLSRAWADTRGVWSQAMRAYIEEVSTGSFPAEENAWNMIPSEQEQWENARLESENVLDEALDTELPPPLMSNRFEP